MSPTIIAWAVYIGEEIICTTPNEATAAQVASGHDGARTVPLGAVPPLTVGAALADPRVQDGSHVVEYEDEDHDGVWWQARFDGERAKSRCWLPRRKAWGTGDASIVSWEFARAARLVPVADADLDPAARGPMEAP